MLRSSCVLLAMAFVCGISAHADLDAESVAKVNNLLRAGQTDAAMQAYRNLQVDDPESELLYFNIGCAQFESALSGANDDADKLAALESARASFDKAAAAATPELRRDARYNRANTLAQIAKHAVASGEHEAVVKAFEGAVEGYETFLDEYPDHEGAQKNLHHMRYMLKKMLQEPPQEQQPQPIPPSEDSGEGDQEAQDSQSEREQDSEQGPQDEPSDQQQGDQQSEDQQGDNPPQDQNEQGANAEAAPDQQGSENQPQQQTPGEMLPDRQTIEAILQALSERDETEQKEMRRAFPNVRGTGPWW